jgi:hypothetical protein
MSDFKADTTEALMKALQYSNLDKENLAELVEIVIRLHVIPWKVQPIGVPVVDGIVAEYFLNPEQLTPFLESVIKAPRIQQFRVTPKGLDVSTQYVTEVEFR